jgi:polysaccharide pyruvyl transferase WcaK-like protein
MKDILVYGWYHHQNIGDDLFVEAFKSLFPTYNFTFVAKISLNDLKGIDAVFIGGGSLLGQPLSITDVEVLNALRHHKIFYIGVGPETDYHKDHLQLMTLAKLIAIRSNVNLDKVKDINPNTIVIPDLVYCLVPDRSGPKIKKSVLILPNISVVPTCDDPHWKHASWEYFKTEFSQMLDILVKDRGYFINFLPLCTNDKLHDDWAATEIISRMKCRSQKFFLGKKNTLQAITHLMSQYEVIITQRYHGIVLAEMSGTSCLTIHHHDKLKNPQGPSLSYYGLNKDNLLQQFNIALNTNTTDILPINRDMFISLQRMVEGALCNN